MVLENAETCIGFKFCGVPTEKLGAIAGKVVAVLGSLAGGTRELDVERMTTIIKNKMIDILNQVGHVTWVCGTHLTSDPSSLPPSSLRLKRCPTISLPLLSLGTSSFLNLQIR